MNDQIGHSRQHSRPLSLPVALLCPPFIPVLPSWDTGGTRTLCTLKDTSKPEFLWGRNTSGYTLIFCRISFFSLLFWLLFRFAYVITITLRLLPTQRTSLVFSSAHPFAFTYITFLCHHFSLWLRNLQSLFAVPPSWPFGCCAEKELEKLLVALGCHKHVRLWTLLQRWIGINGRCSLCLGNHPLPPPASRADQPLLQAHRY